MGRGSDEVLQDLLGLQAKIYHLFDQQATRGGGRNEAPAHWAPAVDIYETGDALVLVAEVPGVDQSEIHLEITDDLLVLHGQRPTGATDPGLNYYRVECPNGTFQRTFRLPIVVDADQARASYRDGVLSVTLPKRDHARARPISVRVEE